MTKEMLEHVEVRLYRMWPSIDRLASGETKKDIATISGANPYGQDWEKGMKDYHGCGDYNLYMLEIPTGAKVSMTLCELGRDFNNFPPILNRKELMVTDPINASYISWLKNRNQFDPAEDSLKEKRDEEEKDEMAVNEKLVDSLIEISKRQERPQISVAPPTPTSTRDAGEVASMYKEAATTAISMVESTSTKLNNSRTDSADPIKQFEAVMGLAKALKGDDSVLLTIMKQSEDRARDAETRSQALLDRLMTRQEVPPGPPQKTFLETLEEHQRIAELMGGKKRRKADDEDDEDEEKKDNPANSFMGLVVANLPIIAPMITGIFGMAAYYGANAMHNMAVAKTGVGAPAAPAPPQVPSVPVPQAQPQVGPQLVQPGSGQPNANGTPPPYIDELTDEQKQLLPFHSFIAMIHPAFLKHLNDNALDGYTFAEWLIDSSDEGRGHYDQLKMAGSDNIMLLLKSYPPLWKTVAPSEPRIKKMVDLFLQYDEMRAREDAQEEEEEDEGEEVGEDEQDGMDEVEESDPVGAA